MQLFGTSDNPAVAKLPQHGFARNSRWEFLGKSTTEGSASAVKLDFGLSSENIDDKIKELWPYKFGLLYSVSLNPDSLGTTLVITNDGDEPFEFQTLLHTYFRVQVSKSSSALCAPFSLTRATNEGGSLGYRKRGGHWPRRRLIYRQG